MRICKVLHERLSLGTLALVQGTFTGRNRKRAVPHPRNSGQAGDDDGTPLAGARCVAFANSICSAFLASSTPCGVCFVCGLAPSPHRGHALASLPSPVLPCCYAALRAWQHSSRHTQGAYSRKLRQRCIIMGAISVCVLRGGEAWTAPPSSSCLFSAECRIDAMQIFSYFAYPRQTSVMSSPRHRVGLAPSTVAGSTRSVPGSSGVHRADAQYVANLKQQMYLLEMESSILKQHGAATASSRGTLAGDSGPGSEFDALVGKLRSSWADREENLLEALRVVKRDLSKHKQLNYSQNNLIGQLKTELQLLRGVKQQDDEAWRRKVTVRVRLVAQRP